MPPTQLELPAHAYPSYPRIARAPATDWLQVPRLLLTLAGLKLQRAWRREPSAPSLSRRQFAAEWEI
jgi:hypothetical protein